MSWVAAAFVSAFFAGITSVLAKCGIKQTDSDVATAIRTCVVLVFAWAMAGISGSIGTIGSIEPRSWLFLVLSGLATGASWICYFKALGIGDVNKVVPVDKMSTVLAALIAIVLFGETSNLAVKLVGTAVITLGTFLMIEKKQSAGPEQQQDRTWLAYALGAAVFAALTSILAKVGIEGVESNPATAIRTCVVLVMAWAIVAAKGKLDQVAHADRRELTFLATSGIATGASWLLYYYAIATGQVERRGADRQTIDCRIGTICAPGIQRKTLTTQRHRSRSHRPGHCSARSLEVARPAAATSSHLAWDACTDRGMPCAYRARWQIWDNSAGNEGRLRTPALSRREGRRASRSPPWGSAWHTGRSRCSDRHRRQTCSSVACAAAQLRDTRTMQTEARDGASCCPCGVPAPPRSRHQSVPRQLY